MSAIVDTLESKENTFFTRHKDSSGKTYQIEREIKITPRTSIYVLKMADSSYYYTTTAKKTQICLHFTVGTISGDVATLTKPNNHMSVHYVIDRHGRIYNLIPLDSGKNWSYHLGSGCVGTNSKMSKSAIGIEVSNYGPLTKKEDGYYNAYKQLYCTEDRHVENISFRGYDYYSRLTIDQKNAIYDLVNYLCEACGIQHNYKLDGMFENDKEAQNFCGIFTHTQVRKDKFDFPYEQIRFIEDQWIEDTKPKVIPEPEPTEEPVVEVKQEPVKTENIKFTEVRKVVKKEEKLTKSFFQKVLDFINSLF